MTAVHNDSPPFIAYGLCAASALPLLGRLGQWKLPRFQQLAFDAGVLSGAGIGATLTALGLQVRRDSIDSLDRVSACVRRVDVSNTQITAKQLNKLPAHVETVRAFNCPKLEVNDLTLEDCAVQTAKDKIWMP